MRPEVCRRMDAIAARSPCWSRSALPRCGGPCGRNWRKGRSQRRTVNPEAQNVLASITRSGESQFAPAPCVKTRQSPPESGGWCRNPRTGTSFCGASQNSRGLFIFTAYCRLNSTASIESRSLPGRLTQPEVKPFTLAERLYTAHEVAARLGVPERRVRDHAMRRNPRIRAIKLGPPVRFRESDVVAFLAAQMTDLSGKGRGIIWGGLSLQEVDKLWGFIGSIALHHITTQSGAIIGARGSYESHCIPGRRTFANC